MELMLGLLGGLFVVSEYTLPQNDDYLEEAAMEGEKEKEREKERKRNVCLKWMHLSI